MTIERRKPPISTRIERQIITGMIVSDEFMSGVIPIYRPDVLQVRFASTVAGWCIEYWERYKKPPGAEIEDIFRTHRLNNLDPDTAESVEEFLASISHEYETGDKFNAQYILDKAEQHFRLSSLETVRHELAKCVAGSRVEDGEALIGGFTRVTRTEVKGVDPFEDKMIIRALDEDSGDRLFKLHGALGDVMGTFERGHLLGIVGASGVGKTWWLMYVALRALFSGYKVLFVSLEMSEHQMIRRIQHWVTGLPAAKWAGQILMPVFDCVGNQTGSCEDGCEERLVDVEKDETQYSLPDFDEAPKKYAPCTECMGSQKFAPTSWYEREDKPREALSIQAALKKKAAIEKMSAIKSKRFEIVQFPSGELTIGDFETYLNNLEYYKDFIPDVIVTDYADKFKREDREYRHGLNTIWEHHKGLAQKRHCLVATASQSNTARTGGDIKQGNWAEDIRKLNLIDSGFAINQTPIEKNKNIYRCGIMKQRHDDFDLVGQVTVLNLLKIGRPYIDSYFR